MPSERVEDSPAREIEIASDVTESPTGHEDPDASSAFTSTPPQHVPHEQLEVEAVPSLDRQDCLNSLGDRARVGLRILTYFLYDGVADAAIATRDSVRVVKVLAEIAIDEALPPNLRGNMSAARKFMEYLAPCGVSSLTWFILKRVRRSRAEAPGAKGAGVAVTTARGIWIVCHRILRQALICRLFTQRGSLEYNLASALGLICTFFREDVFAELHRPLRWPNHFSATQGRLGESCDSFAVYFLRQATIACF